MTEVTVLPRRGEWTVADLADLPDDGLRYELVDGTLLVSPAPRKPHQRSVGRLYLLLTEACPPEPLTLAVEVLSPSSRSVDRVLKREMYEQSDVQSYWVVDPLERSVTVWLLREGAYGEPVVVGAGQQLALQVPFPCLVAPDELN